MSSPKSNLLGSMFFSSFFTHKTCWQSLCFGNLTIAFYLDKCLWQALISFALTAAPILLKTAQTLPSKSFILTEEGSPITSRHWRLAYCAFAQHCLSTMFIWSLNKLLTILKTDISDSNILQFSFNFIRLLLHFQKQFNQLLLIIRCQWLFSVIRCHIYQYQLLVTS